jgi:hypothetical protein
VPLQRATGAGAKQIRNGLRNIISDEARGVADVQIQLLLKCLIKQFLITAVLA